VRFQPRVGHLLAAASEKVVTIFDIETDRQIHSFQVSHIKKYAVFGNLKVHALFFKNNFIIQVHNYPLLLFPGAF